MFTQRKWTKHDGLTIIELMVVLLIVSLVTILTYGIVTTQYRFFIAQERISSMQTQIGSSLKLISDDIGLTGSDASASLFFPDAGASGVDEALFVDPDNDNIADAIRIRADRNGDGVLNQANEDITYRVDDQNHFIRNGIPLCDHVTSLRFYFYNQDGIELSLATAEANQSAITLVRVVLTTEIQVPDPAHPINLRTIPREFMAMGRIFAR